MSTITASDLVDAIANEDEWSELCDEMHWHGGYDNKVIDARIETELAKMGAVVSDPENLDREFYNAYQCTEKGLS